MRAGNESWASSVLVAGALADLATGMHCLPADGPPGAVSRHHHLWLCCARTWLVLRLWIDPLGPYSRSGPCSSSTLLPLLSLMTADACLLDAQISAHHRSGSPARNWRRHRVLYAARASDRQTRRSLLLSCASSSSRTSCSRRQP